MFPYEIQKKKTPPPAAMSEIYIVSITNFEISAGRPLSKIWINYKNYWFFNMVQPVKNVTKT